MGRPRGRPRKDNSNTQLIEKEKIVLPQEFINEFLKNNEAKEYRVRIEKRDKIDGTMKTILSSDATLENFNFIEAAKAVGGGKLCFVIYAGSGKVIKRLWENYDEYEIAPKTNPVIEELKEQNKRLQERLDNLANTPVKEESKQEKTAFEAAMAELGESRKFTERLINEMKEIALSQKGGSAASLQIEEAQKYIEFGKTMSSLAQPPAPEPKESIIEKLLSSPEILSVFAGAIDNLFNKRQPAGAAQPVAVNIKENPPKPIETFTTDEDQPVAQDEVLKQAEIFADELLQEYDLEKKKKNPNVDKTYTSALKLCFKKKKYLPVAIKMLEQYYEQKEKTDLMFQFLEMLKSIEEDGK